MGNILDDKKIKGKCQKFTPDDLAEFMLDEIGYIDNLYGLTVLENSFGNGILLKKITERYINDCQRCGYNKKAIIRGLERDVFGIELDPVLYVEVKNELNEIAAKYGLYDIAWNIYNEDSLRYDYTSKYDYIIGNPPYITYKDIDKDNRIYIKDNFECCKTGKFDYYYAFIELSINLLADNGKLLQLIPSNLYKNVFAEYLREKLKDCITVIYDYPEQQNFSKTMTSSSIFIYDKSLETDNLRYVNKTNNIELMINKSDLGTKWVFNDFDNQHNVDYLRFGDYFNASITIATLCNKAYIVSEEDIRKENLEKSLIYKTTSPRDELLNNTNYIIFPYKYNNGIVEKFEENCFEETYPNIKKHLDSNLNKDRKIDKHAKWFEYGRSQAIKHLMNDKLLLSTIITDEVVVYNLSKDIIPYSGIYIVNKDNGLSLDKAREILESEDFFSYIKNIGVNLNGKSVRISCKDINNYRFPKE